MMEGRVGLLLRAAKRPRAAIRACFGLARGWWYRARFRLFGYQFTAGRNFRVFGRIVLKGPGKVTFGDDVSLRGRITPWTYSPQAHLEVGDRVMMDGVRISCAESIKIGSDSIVGECRIFDTDFHSTNVDRRTNPDAPIRTTPVVIEENVWISPEVGLLPGAWIGKNSVVGFGAVCVRRYPPNVILFGNPAKVVAPVSVEPLAPEPDPPPAVQSSLSAASAVGLVVIALLTVACGDSNVTNRTSPTAPPRAALADVSDSALSRAASRVVLFGHQSVGSDLLAGIRELVANSPRLGFKVASLADATGDSTSGMLLETLIGKNGDPGSKNDAFAAAVQTPAGQRAEVVMQKYCYLDFTAWSDPVKVFAAYQTHVETLRRESPGATIVHLTTPLTRREGGPKAIVKRLLRKTTQDDLNAKRSAYNDLLRSAYQGKEPIFDLAGYESFDPEGNWVGTVRDGRPIPALAPAWTSDGGHLNDAGRRMMAEQFVAFLAKLP